MGRAPPASQSPATEDHCLCLSQASSSLTFLLGFRTPWRSEPLPTSSTPRSSHCLPADTIFTTHSSHDYTPAPSQVSFLDCWTRPPLPRPWEARGCTVGQPNSLLLPCQPILQKTPSLPEWNHLQFLTSNTNCAIRTSRYPFSVPPINSPSPSLPLRITATSSLFHLSQITCHSARRFSLLLCRKKQKPPSCTSSPTSPPDAHFLSE